MGGLDGLTRSLARELAPWNIQVNSLSLVLTDTMTSVLSEDEAAAMIRRIPAGRPANTAEAARMAVSILRSPDYLTGQIIRMDGGII